MKRSCFKGCFCSKDKTVILNLFQDLHRFKSVSKEEMLKQVQHDNRPHGFTLIELLVVVLIIGILAAVAVPQYQKAVSKSRVMQLLVRADAIYKASLVYHLANGQYPTDLRELDLGVEASGATYGQTTISSKYEHVGIIYGEDPAGTRCAVFASKTYGPRVWCTDSDFAIYIDLETQKRYCRNRTNTKLGKAVCRSLAVGEGEEYDGYTDYPLN